METCMGPMLVVPLCEVCEFPADILPAVGNQQLPGAFAFDGPHQPFDDGNAAVLPDRSEALLDSLPLAPCLESVVRELSSLERTRRVDGSRFFFGRR